MGVKNIRRVKRMYPKRKVKGGLAAEARLVGEINTVRKIFRKISTEVSEEQIPKEMLEALDKMSLIILRLSSILKSEHERIGAVEEIPPLIQLIEEATRVLDGGMKRSHDDEA